MPGDLRIRVDVLQVPTEGLTLKLLPQSVAVGDVPVVHFGHTYTPKSQPATFETCFTDLEQQKNRGFLSILRR